jgi:hypothetical protein
MICSVIVLVGVALIGQTRASVMDTYSMPETFIGDPKLSEELDRDQLISKLASPDTDELDTANTLYRAKNKASTVLYNGVRVADLIPPNHMDLDGCSTDALNKRVDLYELLKATNVDKNQDPVPEAVVNALELYASSLVDSAASYCASYAPLVTAAGINSKEWLEGLRGAQFVDINQIERDNRTYEERLEQVIAFIRKPESGQVHL